jgi:hypothetical protein
MTYDEAYRHLKDMEAEQSGYFDAMLRRLEAIHQPPHVIVNFPHLVRVLEERRRHEIPMVV